MTSRIKILPSDVVLMIVDYLDSPSMMNCREVCKSWLDVVEGNSFLWNYFLAVGGNLSCTLNMLNLFSEKSNHSIKAFQTFFDHTEAGVTTSFSTSRAIVETLLKSKDSLKIFSHFYSGTDGVNSALSIYFLQSALQFRNLKSLCGQNGSRNLVARIQSRNQGHYICGASPDSSLDVIACTSTSAYDESIRSLVRASALTLVHLKVKFEALSGRTELSFPNLQVLEIPSYQDGSKTVFSETWEVPKLKVLTLTIHGKVTLIDNFPTSIEEFWIVSSNWASSKASLKKKGLDYFKEFYPKVQKFRFGLEVEFHQEEVIEMVKARKAAVKKGLLVGGVKMRAIEELTLDFRLVDEESLSTLRELVPEVVDAQVASTEVTIEC